MLFTISRLLYCLNHFCVLSCSYSPRKLTHVLTQTTAGASTNTVFQQNASHKIYIYNVSRIQRILNEPHIYTPPTPPCRAHPVFFPGPFPVTASVCNGSGACGWGGGRPVGGVRVGSWGKAAEVPAGAAAGVPWVVWGAERVPSKKNELEGRRTGAAGSGSKKRRGSWWACWWGSGPSATKNEEASRRSATARLDGAAPACRRPVRKC